MRLALAAVLVLAACSKETPKPATPRSPAAADALWALAPEGARYGVVVTPRALQLLEDGLVTAQTFVKQAPELAPVAAQLDARLQEVLGGDFTSLAAMGLDRRRGFAMWETTEGTVLVIPVGERAKLVRQFHLDRGAAPADADHLGDLTCKVIRGAYVCASHAPVLATLLGRGELPAPVAAVGARGDIEVVVEGPLAFGVVAQLERGAVVVRGTVVSATGPNPLAPMLGGLHQPRVAPGTTTGFGVVGLDGVLATLPDAPLVAGVTVAQLARTLGGPLTLTAHAGAIEPDLRLPLTDPAPASTVVARCAELLPPALLVTGAAPGTCRIKVAELGMELDVWVDGPALRVGRRGAPAVDRQVALTALGDELAAGRWTFAFWGRGTVFGSAGFGGLPAAAGYAGLVVRALSLVNELGVAVKLEDNITTFVIGARSVWANPPDVTAKVLAISVDDIATGNVDRATAIAKAAPRAPFAADLAGGPGGLMVPAAATGMLAAIAIPAFMDYQQRGKRSEAELNLGAIGKAAKVHYVEHGALPTASAPLTPAQPCCDQPGGRCTSTMADWTTPAWDVLDFIVDEPSRFRYGYTSDGATLTATAVGDLDCDGAEVTYTLTVTTAGGTPEVTLTRPTTAD